MPSNIQTFILTIADSDVKSKAFVCRSLPDAIGKIRDLQPSFWYIARNVENPSIGAQPLPEVASWLTHGDWIDSEDLIKGADFS